MGDRPGGVRAMMRAMNRWATVTPDGVFTLHENEPTLEVLQEEVGGSVEALGSPDPGLTITVFVNEERKGQDGQPLTMNPKASTFMAPVLWPGQRIVGTVVLAGPPDDGKGI